jgi:uncharacterized protein VirK/YbjX
VDIDWIEKINNIPSLNGLVFFNCQKIENFRKKQRFLLSEEIEKDILRKCIKYLSTNKKENVFVEDSISEFKPIVQRYQDSSVEHIEQKAKKILESVTKFLKKNKIFKIK